MMYLGQIWNTRVIGERRTGQIVSEIIWIVKFVILNLDVDFDLKGFFFLEFRGFEGEEGKLRFV